MIIQTVFQPTIQEIMKNGSLLVSFNIIVKLRKSIFGENIYIKLTDPLTQIMSPAFTIITKGGYFLPNVQLFLAIMVEWWFLNELLMTKYKKIL